VIGTRIRRAAVVDVQAISRRSRKNKVAQFDVLGL
jgi:hypothetical protein